MSWSRRDPDYRAGKALGRAQRRLERRNDPDHAGRPTWQIVLICVFVPLGALACGYLFSVLPG